MVAMFTSNSVSFNILHQIVTKYVSGKVATFGGACPHSKMLSMFKVRASRMCPFLAV